MVQHRVPSKYLSVKTLTALATINDVAQAELSNKIMAVLESAGLDESDLKGEGYRAARDSWWTAKEWLAARRVVYGW